MLPRHDEIGIARRIVEGCCIATAIVLWFIHAIRFTAAWSAASWWWPAFAVAGMVVADLASGIVHWAADTWGRETTPIVGRRLLHPFRVHHVNPDDLLERSFLDANGDVAAIVVAVEAGAWLISNDSAIGLSAIAFVLGLTGVGLWTNQIHQWAHMPVAPKPVRWLQASGLILGRKAHLRHHSHPHVTDYCIVSGCCNGVLNSTRFFRRLESTITWATGWTPRVDEEAFVAASLIRTTSLSELPR